MRLIYMRHGVARKPRNSQISKYDSKLTLRGWFETLFSVKYVRPENIKKIYCSPCTRTLQTAKIVSKMLGVEFEIVDDLKERTGIKRKDIVNEEDRGFYENYLNLNFSGGSREVCRGYFDRNFGAFADIIKKHEEKNENALIIAHSSTLYVLAAFFFGLPEDGQVVWMQCSNSSVIKFDTKNKKY